MCLQDLNRFKKKKPDRLRDLDGIRKSLQHYRDSYSSLDGWVREMEAAQLKAQENKPEDSKALAELLNKQKVGSEVMSYLLSQIQNFPHTSVKQHLSLISQVLVAEIEQKQSSIDGCQKLSEQYSSSIKVNSSISH